MESNKNKSEVGYTYQQVFEKSLEYFNGDEFAASVFAGKYSLTDKNGVLKELTPDDMHRRLAREFSRIESKYPNPMSEEEIYQLMKDFKYVIPQGSPMSAVGNDYQIQSASNCFVAGTNVFTANRGVIPIEKIEIGDKTVTHLGNVKKVTQLHKNPLDSRNIFKIKCFRTPSFKVTGNHKFFSISREHLNNGISPAFNSIEYLRVGDYIKIPNSNDMGSVIDFNISDLFGDTFSYGNRKYNVIRTDREIKLATITRNNKIQKHKYFVPQKIDANNDFAYMLGLWYGDGCIFGSNSKRKITKTIRNRKTIKECKNIRGITFTFGSHETNIINFIVKYMERNNIPIDLNYNNNIDGTTQIVIHSPILGYAFEKWFGRRFDGKSLHESIYNWPKDMVMSLASGIIDSDGTITKRGDIRVVLKNKKLIYSLYHLFRSKGIFVGYSETGDIARLDFGRNSEIRNTSKKTYIDNRILENLGNNTTHTVVIDGEIYTEILEKEFCNENHEYVYTIGVDDDHSYSVEGLISMNCFVIPSCEDSYGGILKTDQEQVQLSKRRGGVGHDISNIRPKGLVTQNAAKTTDGIAVFMERFSNTCREVAQGGRRGALMLTLSIHHPEVMTFITIKRDRKKVTGANISLRLSNEFMNAVKNNEEYEQRWPVNSKNPTIRKMVNAREVWNEIIHSAWLCAEPGILFWDNAIENTPSDIYTEYGFGSISTNPCFSPDTMIAVADGRNAVSIKDLAEEGKDVAVYSYDKITGKVSIKTGRNPRITGYNRPMLRVHLDDDSYLDVTENHKFTLLDGTEKEAKDLSYGDSLPRFLKRLEPVKKGGKDYYRIYGNVYNQREDKIFEHRLIAKHFKSNEWDLKYNEAKLNGFAKTGGLVVHHKDYNSLNNSPDNLEIMTFKDHCKLHGEIDNSGEKNGNFYKVTNEELIEHGKILTKKLNKRFTHVDWLQYAKENNLPMTFSDYRKESLGSVLSFSKRIASGLGIDNVDVDPRLIETLNSMESQGYNAEIVGNIVLVEKVCEVCKNTFSIEHNRREQAHCSYECSLKYINTNKEISSRRLESVRNTHKEKAEKTSREQLRIYSKLKFNLKRTPKQKEWESECKENKIPFRVGRTMKNGFKSYREVIECGDRYNHKVVKIEKISNNDVYNITVDDNHNVGIVTKITQKNNGKYQYDGVFVLQCGEIILSKYDSCRLLAINLLSFVENPFTDKAKFKYKELNEIAYKAQRLMDDLIDIEIEQIDKIIAKIKSDKESEELKVTELTLWNRIREACLNGRRTGLGITALGDAMASIGVIYGSDESIKVTEKIYKTLALGSYRSTIVMAKERGSFPVFSYKLEKDHQYVSKIIKNLDDETQELYKKYGRRNIALTTTAPTGTVSTLTQTTSGIEPAFLLTYTRRKKINTSDENARVDFVDELGDKWQNFTVYHHNFKKWMDISGKSKIEESPYYKATSNDVDWVASVKIQAAAQKWVDHSISKTCNVPANTPEELIAEVYEKAWEYGCKGFTVYRDGCRSGVLVAAEEETKKSTDQDKFTDHLAPKRPQSLDCDIHQATIKGESWTIFVGKFDGRPYELFGGLSKFVHIPKKYKHGILIKNKKRHTSGAGIYDLKYGEGEDQTVIGDVVTVFENPTEGAFTRTISLALRHGAPIQYVVEQLQKDEKDSDMYSFSKVISRVLKHYIKDGTEHSNCPECKAAKMIYKEGCIFCPNCGYSKCG